MKSKALVIIFKGYLIKKKIKPTFLEGQSPILSTSQMTSKVDLLAKKVQVFQPLTIFLKKLHLRCVTGL